MPQKKSTSAKKRSRSNKKKTTPTFTCNPNEELVKLFIQLKKIYELVSEFCELPKIPNKEIPKYIVSGDFKIAHHTYLLTYNLANLQNLELLVYPDLDYYVKVKEFICQRGVLDDDTKQFLSMFITAIHIQAQKQESMNAINLFKRITPDK